MSFGVNDIVSGAKVAWELYEKGFSKQQKADKQFTEFRTDIQNLAKNLDNVKGVIGNVTNQVPRQVAAHSHAWDLDSLDQILGDFGATLRECKKLLQDTASYARNGSGFVANMRWNIEVEPQVTQLRHRVAFHNVKVLTVLKPLELKLLFDLQDDIHRVHSDLATRITEMQSHITQRLEKIEGILNKDVDVAAQEATTIPPSSFKVPQYLDTQFTEAAKTVDLDMEDPTRFPLVRGLDAFLFHFEKSTSAFTAGLFDNGKTPTPGQYLNLMKCVWIMERLQVGNDCTRARSERLWNCYLKELYGKARHECDRFTTGQLRPPQETEIRLLPKEDFQIWLNKEDDLVPPFWEKSYMETILTMSLESSQPGYQQQLTLLRRDETGIEMVNSFSRAASHSHMNAPHSTSKDINLSQIHLIPLYASPVSAPNALSMKFTSDNISGSSTAFSFCKLDDLHRFQQAMTGYKIAFDKIGVKTLTSQSSLFQRTIKTQAEGRIQLWYPKKLETRAVGTDAATMSTPRTGSSCGTRSTTASTFIKDNVSRNHASPIDAEGESGWCFEQPKLPLLVLYLREERDQMSFLAVSLDRNTDIHPGSCNCANPKKVCTKSVIESTRGDLTARRLDAGKDLDAWNLAALSLYQQPQSLKDHLVEHLKLVSVNFASVQDRIEFVHHFADVKDFHAVLRATYHEEVKLLGQKDVVTPD